MNEAEVVKLMRCSRSESEWNTNADKIKASADCGKVGEYPYF